MTRAPAPSPRRAGGLRRPGRAGFARAGFTLIEVLTVVALLIIVLGLMVSLAWDVRRQSSDRLTRDLLVKLHVLMSQYMERHKRMPQVTAFVVTSEGKAGEAGDASDAATRPVANATIPLRGVDEDLPEESVLQAAAAANNRDFVLALRAEAASPSPELFGPLGGAMYDELTLRDAWGTPIVFMPRQHPAIGMALGNRPFFFSAGPDRRFKTPEDNLYSYEQGTSAARGE